jgi:DNA-binding NtrC family response regulator
VSQSTQVQLLRVLDTSTFRHVGGTEEIHVDVRVIAATNRDLVRMMAQGLFREDLYYRLSTISIEVPPLRARRADVGLLAEHFLSVLNERYGARRRLSPEAMDRLCRYDWPGNVRELLHVIEAAIVVSDAAEIRPEHLHLPKGGGQADGQAPDADGAALLTLQELERRHIERVLKAAEGHRGRAARILGVSERNLYRKLREYGLLR